MTGEAQLVFLQFIKSQKVTDTAQERSDLVYQVSEVTDTCVHL